MRFFFVIIFVIVVGALVLADYKWRRWMAARRRDRQNGHDSSFKN